MANFYNQNDLKTLLTVTVLQRHLEGSPETNGHRDFEWDDVHAVSQPPE